MILDKLMYFATGDGANLSGEAYVVPSSRFRGAHPVSSTLLDLVFESDYGDKDYIRLTIASNTHKLVLNSISGTINSSAGGLRIICDSDNSIFCNSNITDCVIHLGRPSSNFNAQNLTGTAKILVNTTGGSFDSLSLANVGGAHDATVSLYYASQVGSDITDTGVNVNNGSGYSVTTSSQAIVVDGTTATDDLLLNERVYKSDGTFVGTCTAVGSGTGITFGGGLKVALADDADLYTGTRYYVLKAVVVPAYQTLILDRDDISFNGIDYSLYTILGAGGIDLITRQ